MTFTRRVRAPLAGVLAAYLDTDFHAAKQRASGAIAFELLRGARTGDRLELAARVSEPSRLPAFLKRGEVDTYVDESVVDAARGEMTWRIVPAVGADVFFLRGVVRFEADGDGTRVTYATELEIRLPLVGKAAERVGLAKTEEEVDRQAAFLERWVNERSPRR